MENEVNRCSSKFKISIIFFLVTIMVIFTFFQAQGVDIVKVPKELFIQKHGIWSVGLTDIKLNIENPQSDDYLVLDYINSIFQKHLEIFNFHIVSEPERNFMLQYYENLENEQYDTENFSKINSESLKFLLNQAGQNASANVLKGNDLEEYIIIPERLPLLIEFKNNDNLIPRLSIEDAVRASVVLKDLSYNSIISSEIEKIGKVYIFRMYEFSLIHTKPIVLLQYSFSMNNLYTVSEKVIDIFSTSIGGYSRASLTVKTEAPGIMLTIGENSYSKADPGLQALPPGIYEVTIYKTDNNYQEVITCELIPGQITVLEPDVPDSENTLLSVSLFPSNSVITTEYQEILITPAKIREILGEQFSLFVEADGYISQNILVNTHEENNNFSYHLRPEWMRFDSEINYGQLRFYKSLSKTILSLPASVLLFGLVSEYDFPFAEAVLGCSLAINFSLLLDTIISLVDYYTRTKIL